MTVSAHPNVYAWHMLVSRFSEDVRASWTEASAAPAQAAKKGGKGAAAGQQKKGKAAQQTTVTATAPKTEQMVSIPNKCAAIIRKAA